jgi:hypothetical protein
MTGLNWLRIGTKADFYEQITKSQTSKEQETSWSAEQLQNFMEELRCSIKLIDICFEYLQIGWDSFIPRALQSAEPSHLPISIDWCVFGVDLSGRAV